MFIMLSRGAKIVSYKNFPLLLQLKVISVNATRNMTVNLAHWASGLASRGTMMYLEIRL